MAASIVQICNLALSALKAAQVQTVFPVPEADSNSAKACHLHYEPARDATLEDRDWQFAKRTSSMPQVGTPPADWQYQYAYPSDCIKLRRIQVPQGAEPAPFEIRNLDDDTLVVVTDQPEAVLVYTARITNPNLFTPGFVMALAKRLAWDMAYSLTGKSSVVKEAERTYAATLVLASSNDASARQYHKRRPPRSIQARR